MFPRAQIRPSGPDHIVIDTFGEFDMGFLAWLKTLEMRNAFISQWVFKDSTYKIPIRFIKETEAELRKYYSVVEVVQAIPQTPVTYRVEYIGACKRRDRTANACMYCRQNVFHLNCSRKNSTGTTMCPACSGTGMGTRNMGQLVGRCSVCGGSGRIDLSTDETMGSYASAWSNGDWSLIFPETVLRKFFPQPVKFDGNFHKALLSGVELNKTYKQLSRQFHPDVKGGSHEMFVRLRKAFDDLKDPQRRKRYEAGLKFAAKEPEEATVFRVPRTCGDVTVLLEPRNGHPDWVKASVKEILSWTDITDAAGRVMSSRFRDINRNPPFDVEWNYTGEFEVDL